MLTQQVNLVNEMGTIIDQWAQGKLFNKRVGKIRYPYRKKINPSLNYLYYTKIFKTQGVIKINLIDKTFRKKT